MSAKEFGYIEGETCWRNGCQGVIVLAPVEVCSCHINPPCGACTEPRHYCPQCDWSAAEEEKTWRLNDSVIHYADKARTKVIKFERRPLDPRRIDYHSLSHTSSSTIKEGVYPPGVTQRDVEAAVRGTFGGCFTYFANGRFKYIAYTD